MKKDKEKRPPLGLTPRHIVEKARLADVKNAIARYLLENKEAPIEWLEEYNDLVKSIYERSSN